MHKIIFDNLISFSALYIHLTMPKFMIILYTDHFTVFCILDSIFLILKDCFR